MIRVSVRGAPSADVARGVGKAVVNSPLFKSAVAGNDPNVGRLVSSIGSYLGRAAPDLDLGACTVAMGGRIIFAKGEVGLYFIEAGGWISFERSPSTSWGPKQQLVPSSSWLSKYQ